MSNQPQRQLSIVALVLLALGFIAAVMINNSLLQGARLDLTEHRLYTLSAGTRNILGNIEEPINFYLFFSDEATADIPGLRTYAVRVREVLQEFAAASNGKLVVSEVDPLPFSEDEDRADQYGLQRIALGGFGDGIYLGLAATNSIGDQEIVPFFQPDRELFLEYDLAKLVNTLANPDKIVVGLLSALPMTIGFDPQTQTMREPWIVVSQAQQLFELRSLQTDVASIDDDVDILWIVHPKELSDATLYAIDQFILGGGKTLIFVDPLAEIEAAQVPPGNPAAMMAAQGSDLAPLLGAWGVEFSTNEVIADDRFALTVGGGGQRPVKHLGLIGIDATAMNRNDVTTANLTGINFGTSGSFAISEDSPAQFEPLVTSSILAAPLPVDSFRLLQNPDSLREGFAPSGKVYTLAARISGQLPSAFPDGAPSPMDNVDGLPSAHRGVAQTSANVVLVADVDLLSDRLWVQVQNFFGRRIPAPFANNGDFVVNLLDNLSGSADLIGIRSRATSSRPFTVVEELRREADAEFRSTEQRLQAELQETEARLAELQSTRQDDASSSLTLSAEQQGEIDRFLEQRTRIRKELRSVQRNLDQDIEDLGTTLKFVNIWLVPLLVIALAPLLARRRKPS